MYGNKERIMKYTDSFSGEIYFNEWNDGMEESYLIAI